MVLQQADAAVILSCCCITVAQSRNRAVMYQSAYDGERSVYIIHGRVSVNLFK